MTTPPNTPRPELEERLRFERLIADLSSKFINLPAGEVDRENEDAQRRVCELLGMELCVLWQWTHDTPRYITITHLYRPLGGPPPPERMDAQDMVPWCLPQVMAGKILAVESMDSLAPEAARDKEVWLHYGIKSALVFPLSAGGQNLGSVSGPDRAAVFRARFKIPSALREHILSDLYPSLLAACELSSQPPEFCFHHVSRTQGIDLVHKLRGRSAEQSPSS